MPLIPHASLLRNASMASDNCSYFVSILFQTQAPLLERRRFLEALSGRMLCLRGAANTISRQWGERESAAPDPLWLYGEVGPKNLLIERPELAGPAGYSSQSATNHAADRYIEQSYSNEGAMATATCIFVHMHVNFLGSSDAALRAFRGSPCDLASHPLRCSAQELLIGEHFKE